MSLVCDSLLLASFSLLFTYTPFPTPTAPLAYLTIYMRIPHIQGILKNPIKNFQKNLRKFFQKIFKISSKNFKSSSQKINNLFHILDFLHSFWRVFEEKNFFFLLKPFLKDFFIRFLLIICFYVIFIS